MTNRRKPRKGETIGGGFIVLRRGHRTGRIRPSTMAFEHATLDTACPEADRLAALNPGQRYDVFACVYMTPSEDDERQGEQLQSFLQELEVHRDPY